MSEFRQPKLLPGESALDAFRREQESSVYESEMARLNAPLVAKQRREAELRRMPVTVGAATGHPAVARARLDFDAAHDGSFVGMVMRWLRR